MKRISSDTNGSLVAATSPSDQSAKGHHEIICRPLKGALLRFQFGNQRQNVIEHLLVT
jgi:hypothetical protein